MIETHCHLTDPRLATQIDGVLVRAAEAGVAHLITIATGIEDSHDSLAVARRFGTVSCTVGIHPNYAQHAQPDEVEQLRPLLDDAKVVAIGECGLDYFHNHADRAHQAKVFIAQLQLAADTNMPVVIHSREAIADTLAILADFSQVRCVFHCFTGTMDEAKAILAAGYLIGFTGPVTYKKNDELRNAAAYVPADRLLVETDAPYLSPEPVRGKGPCEPAFVMHTARKIAEIRGVSIEALDEMTTQNARAFFRAL